MRKKFITLCVLAALLLGSCNGGIIYNKYNHTPLSGWEKNDTLSFDVPRLANAGTYQPQLGLRINGAYPFMSLTLIVEQTVYPGKKVFIDTLNCKLRNQQGISTGQGISYYQYDYPLHTLELVKGDSLHISVRHDMKREILPGISDIGIKYKQL